MNLIRNSLTLAGKDLKILFKDKGQLAVLFLLPFLLAMFYGGAYATNRDPVTTSGEPKLSLNAYIVNQDQGSLGAQVAEVLDSIQVLQTMRTQTIDQADQKVAEGEAPAAIIIPAEFSARIEANQPTSLRLIKDPARQPEAQAIAGILNEVLSELSVRAEIEYGIWAVYAKAGLLETSDPETVRAAQAQTMGAIWTAVQEMRRNPAIAVQVENLAGEAIVIPKSGLVFGFFMPAFATIFAFFMVGHMAESILKERVDGSFRRLLAAPMPPSTVIAGKMLAFIGVVYLQMLVLFGICYVFFDMPLGQSPLGLLVLTLALALAATSLGMLVGSIARTSKQAGNLGVVVGFILMIALNPLSYTLNVNRGVAEITIPTEGWGYYIGQLTPHAHAIKGYHQLLIEGAGLMDLGPSILALLGFTVVFFGLAMWRFKFEA